MNAIKKGIVFYKDVNSKKEYFPKEVLKDTKIFKTTYKLSDDIKKSIIIFITN